MTASSTAIATATNAQSSKPVETRKRKLLCPVCVRRAEKEGKTAEASETLVSFIWVPDVRDLKKFGDKYSGLIETVTPKSGQTYEQGRNICADDGRKLREVPMPDDPKMHVRTYQLSGVLDRAAERRQARDRSEFDELFVGPTPHEAPISGLIGNEAEIRKAVAGEGESTEGNGASQPTETPEPARNEPKPRPRRRTSPKE